MEDAFQRVVVVGTGLIGASVAFALQARGVEMWLCDADPSTARLAAELGAGKVVPSTDPAGREARHREPGGGNRSAAEPVALRPPPGGPADLAVLAVPPTVTAAVLAAAQDAGLARWYTDTASVKVLPTYQARATGCDLSCYVPGHPLAGRERSGPAAARADLFLGRAWALCPLPETADEAVQQVVALVRACGAEPVSTDPATHDQWVALVSHAPHLVAAAMSARLADGSVSERALTLAGQGLRDSTRIAAGDPELWTQILAANAAPVARVLDEVATDLHAAARALSGDSTEALTDLLARGRTGVARIPGKRGGSARSFATVQVVLDDRPGELAKLLAAAAAARINVEDVGIEHSPGLPVGVAELSVQPPALAALVAALAAAGWSVRR